MTFPARLVDGYRDFLTGRLTLEQSRYRELAERGQSPQITVIGCADSRVSPEVIFNAPPGGLFVVRNEANLVPLYAPDSGQHGVSAALEFGVAALKVQHIVVLGHAQCGGVQAFADDAEPALARRLHRKMDVADGAAAEKVGPRGDLSRAEYLTRLEQANVVNSLDNLLTFPRLRKLVEVGRISIHGAYFGVATGRLSVRDPATGEFKQIAVEDYARLFAEPRF